MLWTTLLKYNYMTASFRLVDLTRLLEQRLRCLEETTRMRPRAISKYPGPYYFDTQTKEKALKYKSQMHMFSGSGKDI
uniref:Uncharacterized protein n=1 Tax=Arion vulgaris TaxID=1028688 RepID=A0A0B7APE1_9EUPU